MAENTTTRSFGIVTSLEGLQGGIMVNSIDIQENVQVAEARAENGAVTDLVGFSRSKTASITGIMDSAKGTLATAGSKITLDGKDWLIDSVSRRESNTSFVQLTISARTSDNAIITVTEGSTGTGE